MLGKDFVLNNQGKEFYKITHGAESDEFLPGVTPDEFLCGDGYCINQNNTPHEVHIRIKFNRLDNYTFYDIQSIHHVIVHPFTSLYIRRVMIPDNAVIHKPNEFRSAFHADQLILGERKRLVNHPDIVRMIVERNPRFLAYIPRSLDDRYFELMECAVRQNHQMIQFIPWTGSHRVERYVTLCDNVVSRDWRALKFVPAEYLTKELCIAARAQNKGADKYIPIMISISMAWDRLKKPKKIAIDYQQTNGEIGEPSECDAIDTECCDNIATVLKKVN
jgi:hypothetical protein